MWWFKKYLKIPVKSLKIDIDIHTHLLPGVDDGRFTSKSARETLVTMHKNGIKEVYLTPHIIAGLHENSTVKLNASFETLKNSIELGDTIPRFSLGAEYMVDDTLWACIDSNDDNLLTVIDKHVLIEMSYYSISPQIFDVLKRLVSMGYTPILAHPERYSYMDGCSYEFDKLYEMGCKFQLNLLSTTGIYGEASKRIMKDLLERSYYRFIGSDVHSPEQYYFIYNSRIDRKIAQLGELSSLWVIS